MKIVEKYEYYCPWIKYDHEVLSDVEIGTYSYLRLYHESTTEAKEASTGGCATLWNELRKLQNKL